MSDFKDIPRRIFLDSSCLQTLQDYGSFIYENEDIPESDPIHTVSEGVEKVEALRKIIMVAQRAPFEFALSTNSFAEVAAKNDSRYLQWAYDVLVHWQACANESGVPERSETAASLLLGSSFQYLSKKDSTLLQDALALGCDCFLTMEKKLPKNRAHLEAITGLRVLTPVTFWQLLEPWARLFV